MKPVAAPRCSLGTLRHRTDAAYATESIIHSDLVVVYRGRWVVDLTVSRDWPARIEVPDC
jgi:hypothetical protein